MVHTQRLVPSSTRRIRRALTLLTAFALAAPASAQLVPGAGRDLSAADALRDEAGRAWLVRGLDLPTQGTRPEERALHAVTQLVHAGLLEVAPSELVLGQVRPAHGLTVVRFGRAIDAGDALLPVRNAAVIVALDEQGDLRFAIDRSGPRELVSAALVPEDDDAAITAFFGSDTEGAQVLAQREVALELAGALHRFREVEVGRAMHERARVYLNAQGPVFVEDRVKDALGRVYEPNPPLAMEMTSDVELLNLTSRSFLTGRYVRASSCDPEVDGCNVVQRAEANADGDFLYDPVEPSFDDPFAEVNAYHHTDTIAAYFRDTHDLEWSCCDTSSIIDVIANYFERTGVGYDNAFFSPPLCSRNQCARMAFGQGASRDFGYDGDVIYHEYGHGIVDVTASFTIFKLSPLRGVYYDPGSLNEATADYFAATLSGDPKLADYFDGGGIGGGEGALRNLDGDLRCPDDLFGEVHQDGRIWGQMLWSIREELGMDLTDELAFAALVATPGDADFAEAAEVLLTTAETLPSLSAADVDVVRAELERRGLTDCEPIIPLEDERSYLGFSGVGQITGNLGGSVAPVYYKVDIPADATSFKVQLGRITAAGAYDVYFRVGRAPRFLTGRTPPLTADHSEQSLTEVTFDADSDFPLPRCETLYFALIATDLLSRGESAYRLYTDLETSGDPAAECPEPPEPDAGPSADGGMGDGSVTEPTGDDGCGCRIVGTPTSDHTPLALFGLLGLTILYRRRL